MIDVHSHYLPDCYLKAMRLAGISNVEGSPLPDWSIQEHLAVMDQNGIDACVLSISAPGLRFAADADARGLAREVNEAGAEIVALHPSRFGIDALLPMPNIEASLKEIEYAFDVLKLDGIGLYTNYGGVYLGDVRFRPVLEELNRRKATVFVHPIGPRSLDELTLGFPAAMLEYPFDTTRTVASLVRSGTLRTLPDIRWITAHGGGAVPFLGPQRMAILISMELRFEAQREGRESAIRPEDILAQFAALHFDVTAATTASYLLALQSIAPLSQLLAGFDFPFMPTFTIPPAIANLRGHAAFSESDRNAILYANALRLYPRLAPRN